jgi:large conductance mechanosensitive channel
MRSSNPGIPIENKYDRTGRKSGCFRETTIPFHAVIDTVPQQIQSEDSMSMMKEFKEFAMRGNVMDMAIGIVIGLAFAAIVSSFVADIITPPVGLLLGDMDFSEMSLVLKEAVGEEEAVTISYGLFLQKVFDFIIIAFAIFMVIKGMNRMRRKKEEAPAAPPAPTKEETLLTEIRDLLSRQE